MVNVDQHHRSGRRWPQVTLRETLLLITFLSILYGLSVMRGDRESLLANVIRTPFLLATFVLWRILQHARGMDHVVAQVFVDATLGAAVGIMATVLGLALLSYSFSNILTPLLLGACCGALGGVVVAFSLGRYRRRGSRAEDP